MAAYYDSYYRNEDLHPYDLLGVLIEHTSFLGIINNYPTRRRPVPYETIDLFAGNNRTLRIYVKDANLDIIDLTGATAYLVVREILDGPNIIEKTTADPSKGAIVAPDEGEIHFYLLPADTSALALRQYIFYVNVVLSNLKSYTVVNGVMNLHHPTWSRD